MAQRPVYITHRDGPIAVETRSVDFQWFAGMALTQKQRSIASLHAAARMKAGVARVLEISSKSPDPVGVAMSAFNLTITTQKGRRFSVESAFQASKVFEHGGPFVDLLDAPSLEAKRDPRLQASGALVSFRFFGQSWPLEPKTAFYDWLYINALRKNPELAEAARAHDAFTDIEFNPARSINCQAHAAALFVALDARGWLERTSDPEAFLKLCAMFASPGSPDAARPASQMELLGSGRG
jgi:hypothetical protein